MIVVYTMASVFLIAIIAGAWWIDEPSKVLETTVFGLAFPVAQSRTTLSSPRRFTRWS
ncbi:MAG: hypothetical protein U0165_05765 [Polyangiaceae bacterium]